MADDSVLLARIENDAALSAYLEGPCAFDVTRRQPAEDLHLSSGRPLTPIAGCATGGTYFLCGERDAAERPVLYTSPEGQSGLIAGSLREALELLARVPYWQDCLRYLRPGAPETPGETELDALEDDFRDVVTGFDPARQRAAARALGIDPPDRATVLRRLRDATARTRPDYVVHTTDGWPYDTF
ncbi:hypothetical protein [Streptomyces sp. NPDC049881]|uniref:hypothetical protein n=1 Tax=unclassified Streptomyces TaxID=2593676 RepID=UPI003418524E